MTPYMRASIVFGSALVLLPVVPLAGHSQTSIVPNPPLPPISHQPQSAAIEPRVPNKTRAPQPVVVSSKVTALAPATAAAAPQSSGLIADVTLGDIGFTNGLRFSNLGGRHDIFVPLPEGDGLAASDLVLVIDDVSAHDARRNLEVQVNDRTATAIALDGNSRGRTIRVPLGNAVPKDGYLKLSFLYSGAATIDRCIDVRAVGDTLTIDPETGVNVSISQAALLGVATTAALMPRDVAVVLPPRRAASNEIATAITIARSLISSGRHVKFYRGYDTLPELSQRDANGHWARGIILVGPLAEAVGVLDSPVAKIAGDPRSFGMLATGRIGGLPVLVISDTDVSSAGRLFASPLLAITRAVPSATAGAATPAVLPTDRITFDQLAVAPAQAEVYGRADLVAVIDTRRLPSGTRATRLLLDLIVAPDGAGEKAVVSVFVNERLLGSTVAATGDATHLDLALPDGLVGTNANVRAVIERDSAQGDCRFEPQGYPAQLLGSSSLVLTSTDGVAHDFSDLSPRFEHGLELLLPVAVADQPSLVLGLVAEVVHQLSPDVTPMAVNFTAAGSAPAPGQPFIAVSDIPPAGATPRVNFDRGRVAVADRTGNTLLDLGGFVGGAVAQIVTASDHPGLWIKPMSADGSAPAPAELHLDHGDVAFVDANGVALAMSTERDTVVKVSYPDQVSWLTVAERFRSWIIAGLWLFATAALLLTLQRLFRRRPAGGAE
jgi:cellulose synthase operon protein B